MVEKLLSVKEAGAVDQLNKCDHWIRAAIRHGKIKAQRVGRLFVISESEIERIKNNPVKISHKEMNS